MKTENVMSEDILHIFALTRFDTVGAIVGDEMALAKLRDAIIDAIDSGTGGAHMFQSDGEGYSRAVLRARDMGNVCSPQPGEAGNRRATRQLSPCVPYHRFCKRFKNRALPLKR